MANGNSSQPGSDSATSQNTITDQNSKTLEESLKLIIKPQTQLVTVTLDESNFLLWKFQVEMAIKGYGLHKFIDPTMQAPPPLITDKNGQICSNTEFVIHQRQDSLLCSWLLSTISTNLLSQVIGCKTSLDVWNVIHQNFHSQTAARVMSYKRQLQSIRKGNLSIREYLNKIKNICDMLESSGHKVDETEHVLTILNGLDDNFEAIVAVITSRETTPSVQYVTSILLAHEGRLEQKQASTQEFSINYAATPSGNRGSYRSEQNVNNGRNNQAGRGAQSYGRSGMYGRGRGRGRNNNNRPKCQICEKVGHTALRCYFRDNMRIRLQKLKHKRH